MRNEKNNSYILIKVQSPSWILYFLLGANKNNENILKFERNSSWETGATVCQGGNRGKRESRHLLRSLLCHVALIERETSRSSMCGGGGNSERVLTEWDIYHTKAEARGHWRTGLDGCGGVQCGTWSVEHNSFVYASKIYRIVQLLKQIWIATKKQATTLAAAAIAAMTLTIDMARSLASRLPLSHTHTQRRKRLQKAQHVRSLSRLYAPVCVFCFVKHLNWLQLKSMLQRSANSQASHPATLPPTRTACGRGTHIYLSFWMWRSRKLAYICISAVSVSASVCIYSTYHALSCDA